MAAPPLRFAEYWTLFVRAHESAVLRRVQFLATSAGIGCAVLGLAARRASLVLAAPAVVLVPPWAFARLTSNAAAALPSHPPFRLAAALKMWTLTVAGALPTELFRVVDDPEMDLEDVGREAPHPPTNMVTDHTLH